MDGKDEEHQLSGWAAAYIAVAVTAYWLYRTSVLSTAVAAGSAAGGIAVLVIIRRVSARRAARRKAAYGQVATAIQQATDPNGPSTPPHQR